MSRLPSWSTHASTGACSNSLPIRSLTLMINLIDFLPAAYSSWYLQKFDCVYQPEPKTLVAIPPTLSESKVRGIWVSTCQLYELALATAVTGRPVAAASVKLPRPLKPFTMELRKRAASFFFTLPLLNHKLQPPSLLHAPFAPSITGRLNQPEYYSSS